MSGFYAPAIDTAANLIRDRVVKSWLIRKDLQYHLLRASMVIIAGSRWVAIEVRRGCKTLSQSMDADSDEVSRWFRLKPATCSD